MISNKNILAYINYDRNITLYSNTEKVDGMTNGPPNLTPKKEWYKGEVLPHLE